MCSTNMALMALLVMACLVGLDAVRGELISDPDLVLPHNGLQRVFMHAPRPNQASRHRVSSLFAGSYVILAPISLHCS